MYPSYNYYLSLSPVSIVSEIPLSQPLPQSQPVVSTGYYAHLGVTCPRPHIYGHPTIYPAVPAPAPYWVSLLLSLIHASRVISSKVSLIITSGAPCCHHGFLRHYYHHHHHPLVNLLPCSDLEDKSQCHSMGHRTLPAANVRGYRMHLCRPHHFT